LNDRKKKLKINNTPQPSDTMYKGGRSFVQSP
jgi:hypothetical protein